MQPQFREGTKGRSTSWRLENNSRDQFKPVLPGGSWDPTGEPPEARTPVSRVQGDLGVSALMKPGLPFLETKSGDFSGQRQGTQNQNAFYRSPDMTGTKSLSVVSSQ